MDNLFFCHTFVNILCEKNFNYFSHSSEEKKIDAKRRKIKFVKFAVRLCSDVFLEVLRWGDRRQLVTLEKIGRRLHWQIDGCFKKAPFLCFDLFLVPWYPFLIKIL